jgi:NADPH:quinone reductase-like Zn-dependent oxidoreductase
MEAQSQAVNTTTRAALFRRGGPAADVLFREEVQPVGPGPGGVQVRFAEFGINPTDWKERSSGTTLKDHDVKVPNQDGAGTIQAVGEDVDLTRVGDHLCTSRRGSASTARRPSCARCLPSRLCHCRRRARGPRGEPWHRGR